MRFSVILMLGFASAIAPAFAQTKIDPLPIQTVPNLPNGPYSLAFSPDGRRTLTGGTDGTVDVWDIPTGRLLRSLSGHTDQVHSVVFLQNGTQVASASKDKTVKLWDAITGKLLRTTQLSLPGETIAATAVSPNGDLAVSGTFGGGLKLWDAATGRLLQSFSQEPKTGVQAVAFSADGARIASGSSDGSNQVKVWDTATGRLIRKFSGHRSFASVLAVAFSKDGSRLLSGSSDATVKLWDVASGQLLRTFKHDKDVYSVALSPDNNYVMSGSLDKSLRLWDAATGKLVHSLEYSWGSWGAFSPDGSRVLSGTPSGKPVIQLLDIETGQVRELGSDRGYLSGAVFSADGLRIVSGGTSIKQWNAYTGELVSSFNAPVNGSYSNAVSKDAARVLWRMPDDKTLKLIDAVSGKEISTFTGHSEPTYRSSLSPDGTRVISGGGFNEKTIKLWDAATGRLVRTFPQESVNALTFSPDGTRVLSGNFDKTMKLWDVSSGQQLRTFKNADPVWTIAFSPDGQRILSGDTGNKVKLWDVATGQVLRTLEGHTAEVYHGVTFSPDGTRALSASQDKTVKYWNLETGQLVRSFSGDLTAPAFSPDGARMLVSGEVWDLRTGERLISILPSKDTEWLAITPEGFFNASERGAEILSIVRGFDVWAIDQFFQSLYRPDLVREKLAGDTRGLVRESASKLDLSKVIASGDAPGLRVVSPVDRANITSSQVLVDVEITARAGGVGRIEWRVNNITAGIETSPALLPAGQALRLTRTLAVSPGDNAIEVVAYNNANLIASVPARISVTAPGSVQTTAPAERQRLFVLSAGSDKYVDKRFQLQYSVQDANAIAQAFTNSGKGLYQNVEVKVITDADVTSDKLDAAFQELSKKVQPADVFVLYLAGHGKTVDGRYYFVPPTFRVDGELTKAAIDAAVIAQGIAQEQWQKWMALIGARKSMILFDTCESGTLTGDEGLTKTLEQGAANDRLGQATGRSIMTASSGSTEAFEGYRGHGLFTYNLLDALERADGDNNGTIEISELAAYVYSQVSSTSERVFKQRQEPQIKINLNYALTRQTRVLQDSVPLIDSNERPTFQLTQETRLQIKPINGATVVRSLTQKTAVTVVKSENGWSLIAIGGKPMGYVATRDLVPIQ